MDRLILLRHGEARPADRGGSDLARELTDAGRAAAAQAGRMLVRAGEGVDAVLVSPAARTQATWREARAAWPDPPPERTLRALYEMPPAELLRVVQAEGVARVLLVGHNPSLEALARELSDGDPRLASGFPPGAAAVLAHGEGGWRLARLHRPGDPA